MSRPLPTRRGPTPRFGRPALRGAGALTAQGPTLASRAAVPMRLDWVILGQLLFCVVPSMIAIRLEQPVMAARWVFLTVTLFVFADIFFRAPPADLVLVIGTMPVLMLLRDLFLYNAVVVLLAIPVVNLALRSPRDLRRLRQAGMMVFAFLAFFYWLASFVLSSDYSRNLRIGEMVLGAAAVLLLSPRRQLLATAIVGLLVTLVAMGLAFLGFSDRLSYAVIGGVLLGNPVSYGVPLALVLVLCMGDGGRWIMLQRRPGVRLAIAMAAGLLLLLSTSRASWLAAAIDLFIVFVLGRTQRKFLLTSLAVLVIATVGVMQTSGGASLQAWFYRTFSPDRSLLQKSDGRSDQWMLFPLAMGHAPPWGFGPGQGKEVYARYSLLDDRIKFERGDDMAWHSLYLQVGIELGVIGLAALIILLGRTSWLAFRYWQRTGALMPLLGIAGFLVVAGTVSGMDPFAGMFLGFALLATGRQPVPRRRPPRRELRPAGDAALASHAAGQ